MADDLEKHLMGTINLELKFWGLIKPDTELSEIGLKLQTLIFNVASPQFNDELKACWEQHGPLQLKEVLKSYSLKLDDCLEIKYNI